MLRPTLLGAPRTRLSVVRSPLILESCHAETSTLRRFSGSSVVRLPLVLESHSAEASALQGCAWVALLVCRLYCEPR